MPTAKKKKKPRGKPFEKGNTLGGRKAMPPELKKAFQDAAPECLRVLMEIVRTGSDTDRMKAAQILLDRGYGKPAQYVESENTTKIIGPTIILPDNGRDPDLPKH